MDFKFNLGDKVRITEKDVIGTVATRSYTEYLDYEDKQKMFKEYQIETLNKVYQCGENEIEIFDEFKNMILEGQLKINPIKESDETPDLKFEINNSFMKEYEKIVTNTIELCKKKNKDYGNATDKSFKQFGDVSYQVRCFDKWNRINTLLKNGKAEISESLEDSLIDLANYLFLWVTSRRLRNRNDENK